MVDFYMIDNSAMLNTYKVEINQFKNNFKRILECSF